MAWTAPRTWVAGEVVTAALLNTHLRDNLLWLGSGNWSSYTPTWTSTGTAPAIGNGILEGRYVRIGNTIHFRIGLIPGGTTTYGTGAWFFALPAAARTGSQGTSGQVARIPVGNGILIDISGGNTLFSAILESSTNIVTSYPGGNLSGTTPITFVSGDQVQIHGSYEAT